MISNGLTYSLTFDVTYSISNLIKNAGANVNKNVRRLQFESAIDKLDQEFDIWEILMNLRINRIMHELAMTK